MLFVTCRTPPRCFRTATCGCEPSIDAGRLLQRAPAGVLQRPRHITLQCAPRRALRRISGDAAHGTPRLPHHDPGLPRLGLSLCRPDGALRHANGGSLSCGWPCIGHCQPHAFPTHTGGWSGHSTAGWGSALSRSHLGLLSTGNP